MRTLLLLAVLSGKLDDPTPIPRALVSHKLDDPEGWPPRALPVSFKLDDPPAKDPTPKHSDPAPKVPAAAPAAQFQLWQLKDRANRTWTHTDPRWLQTYVGRVNAALAPRYYAPVLQYGSPCANGACPR